MKSKTVHSIVSSMHMTWLKKVSSAEIGLVAESQPSFEEKLPDLWNLVEVSKNAESPTQKKRVECKTDLKNCVEVQSIEVSTVRFFLWEFSKFLHNLSKSKRNLCWYYFIPWLCNPRKKQVKYKN